MENMECFDSSKNNQKVIATMAKRLVPYFNESNGMRLELLLIGISKKLESKIVKVQEGKVLGVDPFIEPNSSSCGVELMTVDKNGAGLKSIKIHFVVEEFPATNNLLYTKDFENLGIINADKIVNELNIFFPEMNFMLDEDTNEN